jgi:transposase
MVWAAFSGLGTLQLQFVSSRMDSKEYQEVLQLSLIPFLRRFRRLNPTFQQDNASIHSSKATKEWLANNHINAMDWPACSPDVNPMENLWGILVREVYANHRQYQNTEELKDAILNAWANLDQNLLNNLVNSMPRRIFDIIQKNGNVINY